MTIEISNDLALELLSNRLQEGLQCWSDTKYFNLYYTMYENYVENDAFCGNFNPDEIVDNDIINYCKVIDKDDELYSLIKKLYDEGNTDISCETCYSFIEAYDESLDAFLVRV